MGDRSLADTSAASMEGVPRRKYFRTPATAPGPSGPQMARSILRIRRDALGFLVEMRQRYGTVVQFPIPSPPTYLVTDPEAVRRVLVGNARAYDKKTVQYRSLSLVTGEGLLTTDGATWKRQRRLVQPAFHHDALLRVGDHVATAVDSLLGRWGDVSRGAVIDMDEAMMRVALEVVGASLFGTDLSGDADRLAQATLHALDVVVARARVPVSPPAAWPTPANRRLAAALVELDASVEQMIAARQTMPESGPDMLQMLLEAMTGPEGISAREVRDEIVSFMVAGHETVASALMWALWLVAGDPAAAEALSGEADSVLGGRLPAYDDLDRLPVARAVLDESMRLYPPVWLVSRRAREDDVLGGRHIPAGSLVIMTPYVAQRDPDSWDDPDEFRPERFLAGGGARRGVDGDAVYWPFGLGPRMCIGREFAYVEGVLVLSALAGRVRLERLAGHPDPRAVPLVTLRPHGSLPLVVRPRR